MALYLFIVIFRTAMYFNKYTLNLDKQQHGVDRKRTFSMMSLVSFVSEGGEPTENLDNPR